MGCSTMGEVRDSIYHRQLARQARRIAATHPDPLVARRLREEAIRHDRVAVQLAREEGETATGPNSAAPLGGLIRKVRGWLR